MSPIMSNHEFNPSAGMVLIALAVATVMLPGKWKLVPVAYLGYILAKPILSGSK